jgi:5-methylcytosine-specific restriction enzyme subunit McrC
VFRLDLQENDAWVDKQLPAPEADLLIASKLVDSRPVSAATGQWQLRATGLVGAAVLTAGDAGVDLRVAPKIDVRRLLFLMSYAANPHGWRDELVDLPEVLGLPAAIGEALARSVDRALRSGVLQGYQTVEESALTIRGRVRFGDQLRRRFGQSLPVEITYDEFTVDIAENRILRAALRWMLRAADLPDITRRRLLVQMHRLSEVSDLVAGQPLPGWTPSRLNARYGPALRLSELVLRGTSFDLERGAVQVAGFMVNMPRVFEEFVTVALGQALMDQRGGSVVLQDSRWWLDRDKQVSLLPDLVWYPAGNGWRKSSKGLGAPGLVVDAKYKAEKPSGFPNADVYQLLGYCTALGLETGHLVYAAGNEDGRTYGITKGGRAPDSLASGSQVTVTAHALDLDVKPEQLLSQVTALVEAVSG